MKRLGYTEKRNLKIWRPKNIHFKGLLFGGIKLAKNADPNKYVYSGYGIGLDLRSEFSLPHGSVGKNVIIFGVDMSSSAY